MNTRTVEGRADEAVMAIARECARTQEELVRKMRELARGLTEEASRLEKNPEHVPLSHGVIQTEGVEIDRLCAVINEQRAAWKLAIWIAKGEEK